MMQQQWTLTSSVSSRTSRQSSQRIPPKECDPITLSPKSVQTDTPFSVASIIKESLYSTSGSHLYENVVLTGQSHLLAICLPIQTINTIRLDCLLLQIRWMVLTSGLGQFSQNSSTDGYCAICSFAVNTMLTTRKQWRLHSVPRLWGSCSLKNKKAAAGTVDQ